MTKISLRFLSLALLAAGCADMPAGDLSSGSGSGSGKADDLDLVETTGDDVQLLQVWATHTGDDAVFVQLEPNIPFGRPIDIDRCAVESDQFRDCAGELSVVAEAPTLHRFPVERDRYEAEVDPGHSQFTWVCTMVEVRTVTPVAVVDAPSFEGIGFFADPALYRDDFSHREGSPGERLIPADQLREVGQTTLRDGRAAIVHRFVAAAACLDSGGSGGHLYQEYLALKPYAQFSADGVRYRVWEDLANNIEFNVSFDPTIDRQDELL